MANTIANIARIPDLRNRILFTLALLAVFRLGIFIPAPGVDRQALGDFFSTNQNTLFGLYDMFSGGALEQFSVFVLGIMPYISASIIMQILTMVVPQLERVNKEGQQGKNKIIQYTRYLTIGIAVVQSFFISLTLENMKTSSGQDVVIAAGWGFRMMTAITMTAGSCFVMWLGEQISDRGIGNGSSLIITAGIVARLPAAAVNTFQKVRIGDMNLLALVMLVVGAFVLIGFIVFMERSQRRVPIQYAKRVIGRRVYGGQSTHLPLKINTAGVIPPIFASSLLMFPGTIGSFYDNAIIQGIAASFMPGQWMYMVSYVGLIVFFSYFYTAITFNPLDVADNLRKHGGYIPGIRPGKQTADYIDYLLTRLTAAGSLYLAFVCIIPTILTRSYGLPFYFGGTSLIIVVGVCLDTISQVEAHLLTKQYDGMMGERTERVRGRRGRMSMLEQQ